MQPERTAVEAPLSHCAALGLRSPREIDAVVSVLPPDSHFSDARTLTESTPTCVRVDAAAREHEALCALAPALAGPGKKPEGAV